MAEQPERRVSGDRRANRADEPELVVAVNLLNKSLLALAVRVEVADTLDKRQRRIEAFAKWLSIATVALVIAVVLVLNVAVSVARSSASVARTSARTECRALNDANATNARFWRGLLEKFPAVPPGPDATQSERDAFTRSQANTSQVEADIARLGAQRSCG